MTCSQTNTIEAEILSDVPLSAGTLAYLGARARNSFYDYVMTKFKEAEKAGLTKAVLARRLNRRPDQISHLLAAPGNWTIDTIVALLAGIAREELLPRSESFAGRPPRNWRIEDFLQDPEGQKDPEAQMSGSGAPPSDGAAVVCPIATIAE